MNIKQFYKFLLGNRIILELCQLLDNLIIARYAANKLVQLEALNSKLDILRYQTRLLLEFSLVNIDRYEYAQKFLNNIGCDLGGWIKQQRSKTTPLKI